MKIPTNIAILYFCLLSTAAIATESETSPVKTNQKANLVEFTAREKIWDTVTIPQADEPSFDATYTFNFFKVGTIKEGKYKGGELILTSLTDDGPCKGPSCGHPIRLRYIKTGDKIIFLPRISALPTPYSLHFTSRNNPFSKLGLELTADKDFTIPILEYHESISVTYKGKSVNLRTLKFDERDGMPGNEQLYPVTNHKQYGTIYTTKSQYSPQKSFYDQGSNTAECDGAACFSRNALFLFRPDGTYLMFFYTPDFSMRSVLWKGGKKSTADYRCRTLQGCDNQDADFTSVVSEALVSAKDLLRIGKTKERGEPVYGLKDKNHKLLKEFYENYKSNYPKWPKTRFQPKNPLKSYDEFLASTPVFFWRDPFGRLIRFSSKEFLPPIFCEPIIYLYPENQQTVSVKIGNETRILNSSPQYLNGWKILAKPSGELTSSSNKCYPHLFWEGPSPILPMREDGFVVEKAKVRSFFESTLPRLGLSKQETQDFLKAWMPSFNNAPYFFITFVQQKIIDAIAPLEIVPKPDTIIRVFMDHKPLDEPIEAPELKLSKPSKRAGFTVVEWGGLKR